MGEDSKEDNLEMGTAYGAAKDPRFDPMMAYRLRVYMSMFGISIAGVCCIIAVVGIVSAGKDPANEKLFTLVGVVVAFAAFLILLLREGLRFSANVLRLGSVTIEPANTGTRV